LEAEAAKLGMKVNEEKMKYMITAENARTIHELGQNVVTGALKSSTNFRNSED
jgi:hypothetical protein